MPFKYFPTVESCCFCIPSLRTAATIIAVLALVSNPLLAWLMIRHSYALRVSCNLSAANRMDVVDLNINHVISFGFGVNADLGISCLSDSHNETEGGAGATNKAIKGVGWVVLLSDLAFLITSIVFLVKIYRNMTRKLVIAFIVTGMISVVLSSAYGLLYVVVCAVRGKGVALCQLFLTLVDLSLWTYFLLVIQSYVKKGFPADDQNSYSKKEVSRKFTFMRWPLGSLAINEETNSGQSSGRNFMNAFRECCQWIANFFTFFRIINVIHLGIYFITMGLFKFLPKTKRCCCVKNLKTACFLISIYSLVSGLHGIGLSVTPSCDFYLTTAADQGTLSLNYLRWSLFVISILYITSTIQFIVGIVLWIKSSIEVHIFALIVWAVFAFLLACQEIVLFFSSVVSGGQVCFNISDILAIFIYFGCNIYFVIVVSSYVEEQQQKY